MEAKTAEKDRLRKIATERHKIYVLKNKDKVYAQRKLWMLKNKEKMQRYRSERWKNVEKPKLTKDDKAKIRLAAKASHYKINYGISLEQLDALHRAQSGKCAICGNTGRLHLDHNHTTGKVRKLLCRSCNHGIGNFNDNVDLMQKAIQYLLAHESL